jgi:hypothetical protein
MHTSIAAAPLMSRLRARRLPALTIAAATMLSGCYDYLPAPSSAVPPGGEIRAVLTDAGSLQLAPIIGPRVASLDGTVERAGSDSLVLHVRGLTMMNGEENGWSGERLAIPAAIVSSVQVKQLNRTRTVIASVVAIAAVAAALIASHSLSSDTPLIQGDVPPAGQIRTTVAAP